jgi:hypothetical protein
MPKSIQGFGTTFYGKRDFHSDGSYVTTKWIVLFFVPIIPLGSYRVKYKGYSSVTYGRSATTTESYIVYEELPINIRQVIFTFLFLGVLFCWTIFIVLPFLFKKPDVEFWSTIEIASLQFMPFLIPVFIRQYAKNKTRV